MMYLNVTAPPHPRVVWESVAGLVSWKFSIPFSQFEGTKRARETPGRCHTTKPNTKYLARQNARAWARQNARA